MTSNAVLDSPQGKSIETVLTDQVKNNKIRIGKKPGLGAPLGKKSDTVAVGMQDVYKSLTLLADKVLKELDEILKAEGLDGVASLKPQDHTPEATAQRIVDGVTALLPVYAQQHPELEGEELLQSFMETIRGGIKQGYNEAAAILGDIGAFDIDGVKQGIEETMRLVEEKLLAFENDYRRQHGLEIETPEDNTKVEVPEQVENKSQTSTVNAAA